MDPSWKLVLAASAERPWGGYPEKVAAATVEFMLGPLLEDPRLVGHPSGEKLTGLWSARKGAYWIIYELNDTKHEVQVVRIDHRSDVYRQR